MPLLGASMEQNDLEGSSPWAEATEAGNRSSRDTIVPSGVTADLEEGREGDVDADVDVGGFIAPESTRIRTLATVGVFQAGGEALSGRIVCFARRGGVQKCAMRWMQSESFQVVISRACKFRNASRQCCSNQPAVM